MTDNSTQGFPMAAVRLILGQEGVDQPYIHPGGASGITLGYGCDIGADPNSLDFWHGVLTEDQISRLSYAKGKTGLAAKQIRTRFADIKITEEQSLIVFMRNTLPTEIAKTRATYPGIEIFPPNVLGAMTSCTYNRGTDLDWDKSEGDRRLELRNIHDIISREYLLPLDRRNLPAASRAIADQLLSSRRLWANKGLPGLLAHRQAEASLITSALV